MSTQSSQKVNWIQLRSNFDEKNMSVPIIYSKMERSNLFKSILNIIILLIFSLSNNAMAGCNCNGNATDTIGDGSAIPRPITNYVTSPITSGCYIVKGHIFLTSDFVITGGTFEMEAGSQIRVPNGQKLSIYNVTLNGGFHSCDTLWRGFNVTSGGTLIIVDSKVQDAQYAIQASGTAKIMANGNDFFNNYVGVYTPPTGSIIQNVSFSIYDNSFDCPNGPGTLRYPNYSGMSPNPNGKAYAGFEINSANAIIGSLADSLDLPNSIQNMRTGIIAIGSNLQCYDAHIFDLIPYLTNRGYISSKGDGVGIHIRNKSRLVAMNNIIENTPYAGISSFQSWLERVALNDISEVEAGIYDEKCINSANIAFNDIQYFRNRGIVVHLPGVWASPQIVDNLVETLGTEPTSGFIAIGILVDNAIKNPYVAYNNINIHSNSVGINIPSSNRVNVAYNNVSFDDVSEYEIQGVGIAMTGTPNSHLLDNNVYADEDFELITGFVNESSTNNTICCNETFGTNYGYTFFGDCKRPQGIGYNIIRALTGGVLIKSSAFIGAQSHKGNEWTGNFPSSSSISGGAINQNSVPTIIALSQFKVHNCTQPYWPPTIHPTQACSSNSLLWFRLDDGYPSSCENDANCDLVFYPDIDDEFADPDTGDIAIARGNTEEGEFSLVLDYESRRNLFERMWIDEDMHEYSDYIDSFYTATESSTIAEFYSVEREIDTLLMFTELEQDSLDEIIIDIYVLQDSLRKLDSLLYLATTTSDSTTVIGKRDTVIGLMDTLTIHFQGIMEIYKTRVITDKEEIIDQILEIDPENKIDSNEQIVQYLYLTQLLEDEEFEFDSAQTAQLLSVAEQCPREGGSIIYKSRALYQMVEDVLWDDDGCIEDYMQIRSKSKSNSPNSFVFTPNPASGNVNLNITSIEKMERIDIIIIDLLGREIVSKSINHPTISSVSIDLPNTMEGSFVALVMGENGKVLHKQNLVVIRER